MSNPIEIKVGIFGSDNCDKITLRFLMGDCNSYLSDMNDQTKIIEIDNQPVAVSLIDTSGIEEMSEMRYSYYNQAQAYIFVIDIDKPGTINDISRIYEDICSIKDDVVCVIAANNCHLRDEKEQNLIPIEQYKDLENKYKCKVIETSAKTGKNIDELFDHLVRKMITPSRKTRARWSTTTSLQGMPQANESGSADSSKRRSSLFSKRSAKKKSNKDPPPKAPTEDQANSASSKLIDDLKALALAKASQLKKSLLHNQQLEEEIEQLKKQNREYLEKISILEKKLEMKTSQNEKCLKEEEENEVDNSKNSILKSKLHIFDDACLHKLEEQEIIGRGTISEVKKICMNQEMVLKAYDLDIFSNRDSSESEKIQEGLDLDNEKIADFIKQYEIVNNIKNPNIAKALGIILGDNLNSLSILFEYYPYNLKKIVKKLTNYEKVSIIYEISKAMDDVHNNKIIHFGLNPGNILLDSNKHVKLSDFGLSVFIKNGSLTSKKKSHGSSHFIAPELLTSEKKCTEKVDVFSFGALVYYILSKGKYLSIDDDDEISFSSSINEFSRDLISKCCSKSTDERPTFADIIASIEKNQLIDGVDISSLQLEE